MSTLTNRDHLAGNRKATGAYPTQLDAQLADRNGWTITCLEPYALHCVRHEVTIEARYSRATNNVIGGSIAVNGRHHALTGSTGRDRTTVRDELTAENPAVSHTRS